MGLITKPNTFSSGATIVASEHNDNYDTLYNLVNGTIDNDNISASAAILGSKLNLASAGAIGGTTPAAGAFTTISASGAVTLNGNTTIGNASGDALTYHPNAWTLTNAVTVTGTWTDLGTVTTVDINGGTVNDITSFGLSGGEKTIDTILDEDAMGSNDENALATQQSIKAYVDSQVTTKLTTGTGASWSVPASVSMVYVTMIGGGGSGGGAIADSTGGGGGGAGASIVNVPYTVTPSGTVTYTVGAGGAAGAAGADGNDGTASTFDDLTANFGVKGENDTTAGTGGAVVTGDASGTTAGSPIQAIAGGDGAAGTSAGNPNGGGGGSSIMKGAGAGSTTTTGTSATANTGGGGGGGGESGGGNSAGGAGGSGIIILMY